MLCRFSFIDRGRSCSIVTSAIDSAPRAPVGSSIAPAAAVINSCEEFCRALKAARERKGITLAQISTATKIPAYLFAALEHNDLRRWPKGLFRRSFFRDYAKSVGLPVADVCAEFVRLFPDDGSPSAEPAETPVESAASDEVDWPSILSGTVPARR
jgi:hypothetical protein